MKLLITILAILVSPTVFAADRVVGPLKLVERSFTIDQDKCLETLSSSMTVAYCNIELLKLNKNCHVFETIPPQNNMRMFYKPGGDRFASVDFIPNRCGYQIRVTNTTVERHEHWIKTAIADLELEEIKFYIYTK